MATGLAANRWAGGRGVGRCTAEGVKLVWTEVAGLMESCYPISGKHG